MKRDILLLGSKRMDKRGFIQFVWAGAALLAAGAWLVSVIKPKEAVSPTQTLLSSIPIWGWIVVALIVLVLIRR